jgi:hypothetical protein
MVLSCTKYIEWPPFEGAFYLESFGFLNPSGGHFPAVFCGEPKFFAVMPCC